MNLDLSNLNTTEVIIVAIVGLLVLLFGYRIKKVAFFIIWFIIGFYLTHLILPNFEHMIPEGVEAGVFYNVLPIGGGLLLAMLGFSIEKLCVGGICFAMVMLITTQYFGTEIQSMVAGGILGIIAAGASVMLMKPAIIVATAVAGAYTVTMAILTLAQNAPHDAIYFPSLIALSIVGAGIQFLSTRGVK